MGAVYFILRRQWLPSGGNLLAFGVWISVLGVAMSVALLTVVLAVMSGFTDVFQRNFTRIESDMVISPLSEYNFSNDMTRVLAEEPGVQAFSPIKLSQGMVLYNGVGGVVLEGVDWDTTSKVTPWEELWVEKPKDFGQPYPEEARWIWLGEPLAKKLKIHAGSTVDVLITDGQSRRVVPFLVTGIFKLGMYEHDLRFARIDIRVINDLFRKYNLEPKYKVKIKPGFTLKEVARSLATKLKGKAVVRKWTDLHTSVLKAVEHQKHMLYLILQILVGLAAMNVVSLLLVTAYLRRKELAILQAMGLKAREVFSLFLWQGIGVGIFGVLCGGSLGILLCYVLNRFQPSLLNESIYNVTRLPIQFQWMDLFWVCLGGLVVSIVFSSVPAWFLMRRQPLEVLKQE